MIYYRKTLFGRGPKLTAVQFIFYRKIKEQKMRLTNYGIFVRRMIGRENLYCLMMPLSLTKSHQLVWLS